MAWEPDRARPYNRVVAGMTNAPHGPVFFEEYRYLQERSTRHGYAHKRDPNLRSGVAHTILMLALSVDGVHARPPNEQVHPGNQFLRCAPKPALKTRIWTTFRFLSRS